MPIPHEQSTTNPARFDQGEDRGGLQTLCRTLRLSRGSKCNRSAAFVRQLAKIAEPRCLLRTREILQGIDRRQCLAAQLRTMLAEYLAIHVEKELAGDRTEVPAR